MTNLAAEYVIEKIDNGPKVTVTVWVQGRRIWVQTCESEAAARVWISDDANPDL